MARIELIDALAAARAHVAAGPPVDSPSPKFARLTRKDARIRPDQSAALSVLAENVMARRETRTERLTENTLIRVAIDLLLAHAAALHGSTENELRASVTPVPRTSNT